MPGGGMRVGHCIGETVEFGLEIARDPIHVNGLQTKILYCLGLDRERLTYEHARRKFRLADVPGHVVRKLLRGYRDRHESRTGSAQQVRHGSIHE
jgi:hypothetical protein